MGKNRFKLPFESADGITTIISVYLEQYWIHQWLAASRGLLPDVVPDDFDIPPAESFETDELEDDDEALLVWISVLQEWLDKNLSQLENYLRRLEASLLATRVNVWVSLVLGSLYAGILLSMSLPPKQTHQLSASIRYFIPLLPWPIALFFIALRERSIYYTKSYLARVGQIRESVAGRAFVPSKNIGWFR
ncbi:hypothetical protein AA313_de0208330 [Arthrobotrys entomopaga]|nr:hypothetical protein AA313_de0208330 [Arthrobotrys entomopaga]